MFSLDLRSLALMRIILGCAILRDLSIITSTLGGLLGDQSVLPPHIAFSHYFEQNYRTIHIISGKLWWQILLMSIHIALAIAFTLGRKTKYITPLLWFFVCSLQGANPLITNGGDSVVRLTLLRSIFLPIAQVRSIDSFQKEQPKTYHISSLASVGYILQVLHIYVRNYFLKTDPIRKSDYTATYYTLSLDSFAKNFGLWIYQYPILMKALTRGWIHLELRGSLLFLLPFARLRIIIAGSFIVAHIMMNATLYLGAFPWYAIAIRCGVLPSIFWNSTLSQRCVTKISSIISTIYSPLHQRLSRIAGFISNSKDYIKNSTTFPFGVSVFILLIIGYSFMRNLRSINFSKRDDYFPTSINRFGFLLRLDQYRAMFAPYPKIDDGWYNITGKTERDGSRVNITHPDRPPFDSKPSHTEISTIVPHEKWRKLIDNLRQRSNSQYREYFAAYLCKTYNAKATKYTRITSINLTYMQENTKLDYQTDPIVPVDLGTWECPKSQ